MATNHTENYQLNLWEPQDSFLREEFNENTEKIDAALNTYKSVSGTYVGSRGTAEQHIILGFRPRLLLIVGDGSFGAKTEKSGVSAFCYAGGSGITSCSLILTDDGFTLEENEPYFNNKDCTYTYFAFR